MVFGDMLGSTSSRNIDQFFLRGRHNMLYIYYLSQSYFDLAKRIMRNNIKKYFCLLKQIKDIEIMYRDVGGYDMSYDEFKELSRKSWKKNYNFVCIDRSKKRDQERCCIFRESKNTYLECSPQAKAFRKT